MRKLKKLAAGLAALTMVVSLAACGSSGSDDSSMAEKKLNEDQQAVIDEIAESKADDRVLENTEIKWFSFWDINPTGSDDKDIGVDLALFQTKYNGKITYISTTWEKKFDDLAALVMSGDSPDFCGADDMDMFPKGAIKNMLDPIDDYIDFDSEPVAPYVFREAEPLAKALDGEYDMDALRAFRDRYIDIDTENCTAALADFIESLL